MSIGQNTSESKSPDELPEEEEFDIVSVTGKPAFSSNGGLKQHAFMGAVLVLVASISFGIGKLISYDNKKEPVIVAPNSQTATAVLSDRSNAVANTDEKIVKQTSEPIKTSTKIAPATSSPKSGPIVASKNGKKYYLTTCSGANRIKDENKIYFSSAQEARKAGLTPSSTCKGLE